MVDEKGAAEPVTPLRIWKSMDAERRLKAATAFWKSDTVRKIDLEAASALLGQSLRFRPQSIRTAPLPRRASWLANFAAMNDHLAANVLFAHHMENQIQMMSRFLDVVGVPHEDGRIAAGAKTPSKGKLAEGVTILRKEFDAQDARIYLETLLSQDDEMWGGLAPILTGKAAGASAK